MNIITSDIVSAKYDALWDDAQALTAGIGVRPILILMNETEQYNQDRAQLQKMLEASKLLPEQYNVIVLKAEQSVAWHKLREKLDPKIVFLIGVLPVQLGISSLFRLNEPNNFNDRIFLPTISITDQDLFPEMKKQLWVNGMKPVFVDKKFVAF